MQQVRHLTAEADHAIYAIHTKDITETNALIYSMTAVKVIARHISTQKNSQNKHSEFHTTMEKARKPRNKIKKWEKTSAEWRVLGKKVQNTDSDSEAV